MKATASLLFFLFPFFCSFFLKKKKTTPLTLFYEYGGWEVGSLEKDGRFHGYQ